MQFLKDYGTTCGPLGLPMTDQQAFALDTILKDLPKEPGFALGHLTIPKATTECSPGERADVSWISTEAIDRSRDIVLSKGMDDSHFVMNPIVTLNHAYWHPPVGKSLWRKQVKEGGQKGIKAKTVYPSAPANWQGDWPPDVAFGLVQAGLLAGKSVGFLPKKVKYVTDDDILKDPTLKGVWRVIEEWLLIEYACCYVPDQQHAVVTEVAKHLAIPDLTRKAIAMPEAAPLRFTPLEEYEKAIGRIFAVDLAGVINQAVNAAIEQRKGRV